MSPRTSGFEGLHMREPGTVENRDSAFRGHTKILCSLRSNTVAIICTSLGQTYFLILGKPPREAESNWSSLRGSHLGKFILPGHWGYKVQFWNPPLVYNARSLSTNQQVRTSPKTPRTEQPNMRGPSPA